MPAQAQPSYTAIFRAEISAAFNSQLASSKVSASIEIFHQTALQAVDLFMSLMSSIAALLTYSRDHFENLSESSTAVFALMVLGIAPDIPHDSTNENLGSQEVVLRLPQRKGT